MRRVLAAALLTFMASCHAPAAELAVLAELGMRSTTGGAGLAAVRLRSGDPLSIVSVSEETVQAWSIGRVSEPTISGTGGRSPVFADFDGDGFLDLAVIRGLSADPTARVVVLKGDGAGGFAKVATISIEGYALALAAGDVDGDGRADLVLASSSPPFGDNPELLTLRSRGGFQFDPPRATSVLPSIYNIGSITAGDVDGDGRADVVVSQYQGPVGVFRSVGDGTFALVAPALIGYYPRPAILVDLDGDGRPDLAYLDIFPLGASYIEIFHNDGGGRFGAVPHIPVSPYSRALTVADVDGDGKLDLVLLHSEELGEHYVAVYAGDGRGGFGVEKQWPTPSYSPLSTADSILELDWNGDGLVDLVAMSRRGPVVLGASAPRTDVLTVPVLLSTTGLFGSRFDSDLLLTNSGATAARVMLRYAATLGGGSGTVERDIWPGQQLFAASAFDFLRGAGLPIASSGPIVGTLRITTSGAVLPSALSASVRTTSPSGAGVSYGGLSSVDALRGDALIPWLVESARDRTNVALVHAGADADGPITLRVTVESGDPTAPGEATMPDVVLAPGGFFQIGRALAAAGLSATSGWARISRVSGNAPYLAWGIVNDAASGDGSFVPAVDAGRIAAYPESWILPSAVQSSRYTTELVVTNAGESPSVATVTLAATGSSFQVTLAPHQTWHVGDLFAELRRRGVEGAPEPGVPLASPVYIEAFGATERPRVLAGARVSTAAPGSRFYGVFEPAVGDFSRNAVSMIVPGLRQDEKTRTNLGIVNMSPTQAMDFRLEIYDGASGSLAASKDVISVGPGGLVQINSVLRELAPSSRRGWARIIPKTVSQFIAYGVVMDGANPGERSDDGSFVLGTPE
jgi:hypothetical protein